jgi:hypothetical protein
MSTVAKRPPGVLDNLNQLSKDFAQVAFASDLHLDFGDINPEFYDPTADVLVLAGDIIEAKRARLKRKFFKDCSNAYEHVLYVPGNHEYYDDEFPGAEDVIKEAIAEFPNIHLMQRNTFVYGDIVFIGATLWTDIGRGDPVGIVHAPLLMADYKVIKKTGGGSNIKPIDTMHDHKVSRTYIEKQLKKYHDKTCIVVSHHGSSYLSIHQQYANDRYGNMNFVSDLSDLMLDHPNLKHWIHGHVHNLFSYKIGQCQVHVNPRGYPGERPSSLPAYRPLKFGV